MANIVDMFKLWSESPQTSALQGLLDPSPGYAQQYLDPMSPNNPFELQQRAMGLLGGMQQQSNTSFMAPPTQYMEQAPAPAQAGPLGPQMIPVSMQGKYPWQTDEGSEYYQKTGQWDTTMPYGGLGGGWNLDMNALKSAGIDINSLTGFLPQLR